ncbi:hypothetical protein SY89_01522 [Halolamina pelagica]|uniref:Uncharacterized protein n=1 Tax=Halolamina pelagica TaxID=699431 RepID=A0A0P7FV80_9EURY|nr:hypothetical protein SY89_01522 [Halolamina pelagica]
MEKVRFLQTQIWHSLIGIFTLTNIQEMGLQSKEFSGIRSRHYLFTHLVASMEIQNLSASRSEANIDLLSSLVLIGLMMMT